MTALNWDLAQIDDKLSLRLNGELSRNTLLPLWQQRAAFLSVEKLSQSHIEFDLTNLTRIDSAGFALLCDFLNFALRLPHKKVSLKNPPNQLLTLSDLVNLKDYINSFIHN